MKYTFSFCFSEKFFLSPSILNANLAVQSILSCSVSPSAFKYIFTPFLCAVSPEESVDSLIGVLYVWLCFSPATLQFSLLLQICHFIYDMSWCEFLRLKLFLRLFVFWMWKYVFFFRFRNFPAIMSSDTFSTPFSLFSLQEPYNENISMLDVIPEVP